MRESALVEMWDINFQQAFIADNISKFGLSCSQGILFMYPVFSHRTAAKWRGLDSNNIIRYTILVYVSLHLEILLTWHTRGLNWSADVIERLPVCLEAANKHFVFLQMILVNFLVEVIEFEQYSLEVLISFIAVRQSAQNMFFFSLSLETGIRWWIWPTAGAMSRSSRVSFDNSDVKRTKVYMGFAHKLLGELFPIVSSAFRPQIHSEPEAKNTSAISTCTIIRAITSKLVRAHEAGYESRLYPVWRKDRSFGDRKERKKMRKNFMGKLTRLNGRLANEKKKIKRWDK